MQLIDDLSDLTVSGFPETEKFGLLADLGVIEIPHDYNQATCLTNFHRKNRPNLSVYNPDITDANFSRVTTRLVARRRFRVCAWIHLVGRISTPEERLSFLAKRNSALPGAQGLALLFEQMFEQKRPQLLEKYQYASLDNREALWKDIDGSHRVPAIDVPSRGNYRFILGHFDRRWSVKRAFLSFCRE
jgi:hypothetical protein